MRLYIFCEGQTEETFANLVLGPHFVNFNASIHPLLLPNAKGANARRNKGGWNSYRTARHFMHGVMQSQHRDDVWFTTLFDYYALPEDYPSPLTPAPAPMPATAHGDVVALEEAMARDLVTDTLWRFTPHLQLHEFEALLLVDIDRIGAEFPERIEAVPLLKADIQGCGPEDVNNGADTHPSARITGRIPEYAGRKASAGPIVASHIGLERLRQACPHFSAWVAELERRLGT